MNSFASADGTAIAYDRHGSGPAVVLVGGGLDDGAENAPLARELARWYTVYNYARRGRAASGDTPPYALAREIEDLAGLIAVAGGSAHAFGASSGAALVFEAAAAGLPIRRIGVYEVPYPVGDAAVGAWRDYAASLESVLATGGPQAALAHFMRLAGLGEADIDGARQSPSWAASVGLAHTLPYDAACLGDGEPPVEQLAKLRQPVLVTTGGREELFEAAAEVVAASLPAGVRETLTGQGHVADPAVMARRLREFFGG